MATMYWVGGAGNWDGTPGHWSNSSGGVSNGVNPSSSTDIVFDANSGVGAIAIDGTVASCKSLSFGAGVGALILNGYIRINGDANFTNAASVITTSLDLEFQFFANNVMLTSAGKTFSAVTAPQSASVSCSLSLADDLSCTQLVPGTGHTTFNTNNHNVTVAGMFPNGATINLGSSLITISDQWSGSSVISAGTSTIRFVGARTVSFGMELTGNSVNIIENFTTGTVGLNINNGSIASLTLGQNSKTALYGGQTLNVGNLVSQGILGNQASIFSNAVGTQAILNKTGGGVALVNYVSVKDINGTPGSSFTCINGTDAGNNTGWSFGIARASVFTFF